MRRLTTMAVLALLLTAPLAASEADNQLLLEPSTLAPRIKKDVVAWGWMTVDRIAHHRLQPYQGYGSPCCKETKSVATTLAFDRGGLAPAWHSSDVTTMGPDASVFLPRPVVPSEPRITWAEELEPFQYYGYSGPQPADVLMPVMKILGEEAEVLWSAASGQTRKLPLARLHRLARLDRPDTLIGKYFTVGLFSLPIQPQSDDEIGPEWVTRYQLYQKPALDAPRLKAHGGMAKLLEVQGGFCKLKFQNRFGGDKTSDAEPRFLTGWYPLRDAKGVVQIWPMNADLNDPGEEMLESEP